jgi:hypothetical protein
MITYEGKRKSKDYIGRGVSKIRIYLRKEVKK